MGFFNGGSASIPASLSSSKYVIESGDTFTITFSTPNPEPENTVYSYTITGVDSSDIAGASLTGTFLNDGDTLTLASTSYIGKDFKIKLDNFIIEASIKFVTYTKPLTHIFGTYLSKGGPSDDNGASYYCQGGCDVYFYWRTIPPIPNFTELTSNNHEFIVLNNQWYIKYNEINYQVDFIYANYYYSKSLGDSRVIGVGPFSPHGIGITYVKATDPCIPVPNFFSPAFGDELTTTDIITYTL